MTDVRMVIHQRAIDNLARDPGMATLLLDAAMPVVRDAYVHAPKRSGRGAASIHAEPVLDGPEWTARISWDPDHFYMYFHERGTHKLPARPFLVPALEAAAL
jgi:hypothetical protein